jgi:uncharacterized protein (TIGR02594 family)
MRLVTVSTALALSIAAFSSVPPAFAVPAKKDPAAKQQRAASFAPVKNASVAPAKKANVAAVKKVSVAVAKKASVTPAKKAAIAKHQSVAPVATVKKAAIAKPRRIASVAPATVVAFDRHDLSASANFGQQAPQNVRVARAETAGSAQGARMPRLFASADPVSEARRWIGLNPTSRDTLWCATFMNFVLERSGYQGTGSDAAKSFASYGQRVSGPQVGAIAVMTRGKNGGHVGIVSGIDWAGNPIVISGNHGKKVGEGVYPRGRVYAYVLPR